MNKTLASGIHLRVLSKSYLMDTNMTGIGWFSRIFCIPVLCMKVALALKGLKVTMDVVKVWSRVMGFEGAVVSKGIIKQIMLMTALFIRNIDANALKATMHFAWV